MAGFLSTRRRPAALDQVRVDPIACDGIGMCAHLAPGVIAVDRWGYPVLPVEPISGRDLRAARAAATACPRRALFLESDPLPPRVAAGRPTVSAAPRVSGRRRA